MIPVNQSTKFISMRKGNKKQLVRKPLPNYVSLHHLLAEMRLIFLRYSHTRTSLSLGTHSGWFLTADRCLSCGGGKGGQGAPECGNILNEHQMWRGEAAKSCALHKSSEGRYVWDMLKEGREGIETRGKKQTKDKLKKNETDLFKITVIYIQLFPGAFVFT